MLKGLAYSAPFPADIDTLNCAWWMDWGCSHLDDPRYVPMLRTGLEGGLPRDYSGYCLLYNEPENKEPNGMNASVTVMAQRYINLLCSHPNVKWVAGGTGWNKYSLITSLRSVLQKAGVPLPYAWHVHGYVYRSAGWTTTKVKYGWASLISKTKEAIWVTEYGVPDQNKYTLGDFKTLTDWITHQPRIERYAAYTNRQQGTQGWEIGHGCDLLTWPGELTPVGSYYASK